MRIIMKAVVCLDSILNGSVIPTPFILSHLRCNSLSTSSSSLIIPFSKNHNLLLGFPQWIIRLPHWPMRISPRLLHYANYSPRSVSAAYLGLHPSTLVFRMVDNVDSRLVPSTALHGPCSRVVSGSPRYQSYQVITITPVRLGIMVYMRPAPALCSVNTVSTHRNKVYQSAKWQLPKTKNIMPYQP